MTIMGFCESCGGSIEPDDGCACGFREGDHLYHPGCCPDGRRARTRRSRDGHHIHAIETRYAGCRFRSRLEARWAVFFDTLGIKWEYEPQGFDLDALVAEIGRVEPALIAYRETGSSASLLPDTGLGGYLPDFWLPTQQTWVEVKGADIDAFSLADQRLHAFGAAVTAELVPGRRFVVCFGGIPIGTDPWSERPNGYAELYAPHWDNFYAWNRCRGCGSLDMTFEGRAGRNYCGCEWGEKWATDERVLDAFERARSARFEHGETP